MHAGALSLPSFCDFIGQFPNFVSTKQHTYGGQFFQYGFFFDWDVYTCVFSLFVAAADASCFPIVTVHHSPHKIFVHK